MSNSILQNRPSSAVPSLAHHRTEKAEQSHKRSHQDEVEHVNVEAVKRSRWGKHGVLRNAMRES